ncbi:hypothetical protein ASD52_32810 [Ensifer sp. Root142]|nr:hypothetical protein ASD52_32810 [Ensifer sp. Root142]
MWETYRRMKRQDPNVQILSESAEPVLCRYFRRVHLAVTIAMVLAAIATFALPGLVPNGTQIVNSALPYKAAENLKYFENVNPNFAARYLFSILLFEGVTTAGCLYSLYIVATCDLRSIRPLTIHQLRSLIFFSLFASIIVYFIFGINYIQERKDHYSALEKLFLTDWINFINCALFLALYLCLHVFIVALVKIIRFRGELIND